MNGIFREIIDISQPLAAGMDVWPGDSPFELEAVAKLADGETAEVSRISMSTHCGTHVDAPAHVLAGGRTIDAVPLDRLIGPAVVVEAAEVSSVAIQRGEIVLIKAGDAGAGLSEATAGEWIAAGVRAVGTSAASIESAETNLAVHRLLLGAGVAIIENLRLDHVACGRYFLVCLPLNLSRAEAAPARAVLLR